MTQQIVSTHECETDENGGATCGGDTQCAECGDWFGWCLTNDDDDDCCEGCAGQAGAGRAGT